MRIIFGCTALLLVAVAPVRSQESALDALLAAVDARNPRIAAARSAAAAAEARVSQAGALPDPMLGVGLMNVPVRSPGLGNEMMTMAQARIDAGLPWPGKLSLAEEGAALQSRAAEWAIESVRLEVRAEVQSLYVDLYFLDRAAEIVDRNAPVLADLATAKSAGYTIGRARQVDVLDVEVEHTRLLQERTAILEQRGSTVAKLRALLGRPVGDDIDLSVVQLPQQLQRAALSGIPSTGFTSPLLTAALATEEDGESSLPSLTELQRRAAGSNPAIQEHLLEVQAQESAVALAERGRLPDFNVSAGYSYRSGLGDLFDVMVSAPLPIFAGRKQTQAVVEQRAMLDESEASHHAMLSELEAEIATRHAEVLRIRQHLHLLAAGILPQARAAFSAQLAGYRVGDAPLDTVLTSQAELYRHELEYHRLLSDFARGVVALERLVGTEVLR
jgi:cobalt-zinc-cadmium efflux system outer membrane protein